MGCVSSKRPRKKPSCLFPRSLTAFSSKNHSSSFHYGAEHAFSSASSSYGLFDYHLDDKATSHQAANDDGDCVAYSGDGYTDDDDAGGVAFPGVRGIRPNDELGFVMSSEEEEDDDDDDDDDDGDVNKRRSESESENGMKEMEIINAWELMEGLEEEGGEEEEEERRGSCPLGDVSHEGGGSKLSKISTSFSGSIDLDSPTSTHPSPLGIAHHRVCPTRKLSFDGGNIEHFLSHTCEVVSSPSPKMAGSTHAKQSRNGSSSSPLFDPSIMATFEHALKLTFNGVVDPYSTSKVMPVDENDEVLGGIGTPPLASREEKLACSLASYPLRCPPRGEHKVVLYFTSLRGVRKTYEECCNARLILRGLGVSVDDRDVWMHSKFRQELVDLLGDDLVKGVPHVPRLFIKGRYIGGSDEVKQLHEEGILAKLMDGLTKTMSQNVCDCCGDARFVPCSVCNGSCKVMLGNYEVSRCLECNENGLIMCPICIS